MADNEPTARFHRKLDGYEPSRKMEKMEKGETNNLIV